MPMKFASALGGKSCLKFSLSKNGRLNVYQAGGFQAAFKRESRCPAAVALSDLHART
ncbi:protein of unknown function [Streptomyces murinus]